MLLVYKYLEEIIKERGNNYDLVNYSRWFHRVCSWRNHKKGGAMGIISNVIAGLVGSSVGQSLFGAWGPTLGGMALIPSILGAVIVVTIVSIFFGKKS